MRTRRGLSEARLLCAGPGRLAAALAISGAHDGVHLQRGVLRLLATPESRELEVVAGPRIGISRAADWPLRFYEAGSPYVSRSPRVRDR